MIQPGLERIGLLLKDVHFPWKAIHVAGTNGKGSICAYASTLLSRRAIRCGRFTSPHVIDRWDCIAINDKTVDEAKFRTVEKHFLSLNQRENIGASEFEVLTATAFQLFNDEKVEVGVVEVGMGGRLDATNILNNQVVSVISKIAREHQNFLGNTLEEIAHHKAGILRPNVPYVVNPINEWNVHDVISQYAKEIGAGPLIHGDTEDLQRHLYASVYWHKFAGALEAFRRDNAVLAYLAVVEALKSMGQSTQKVREMLPGIRNKQFPGRFQSLTVDAVFGEHHRVILVDGAHNTDAALALKEHVGHNLRISNSNLEKQNRISRDRPVTWVVAMSDGKDALDYLSVLLEPGDNIVTTSFGPVDGMPWVKPMNSNDLLQVARKACPGITGLSIPVDGPFRALCAAKYLTDHDNPIVVTGSLYLVGDLLRQKARWEEGERYIDIKSIDIEERNRVNTYLSRRSEELGGNEDASVIEKLESNSDQDEKLKLEQEIEKLDLELNRLEQEENALEESHLLELQRDIAAMKLDSVQNRAPGLDGTSLKQKFFHDFEDIREQLQKLPGPSQISTPSIPLLQDHLPSEGHRVLSQEQAQIGQRHASAKTPVHTRTHHTSDASDEDKTDRPKGE